MALGEYETMGSATHVLCVLHGATVVVVCVKEVTTLITERI